jgi:hypothetical protein
LLEFQQYCKENKIITLCMPPHSSHILQTLNVGCFAPLKVGYGRQAENLMRSQINHITILEFLPCFKAAFNALITTNNSLGGFRGAGLAPFDPEAVISKFDVRLRTPSLPPVCNAPWQSQTPSNTLKFRSQSKLIRERIQHHVDSSPSLIVNALEKLSKGAERMAHSLVLMRDQVAELQAANKAATQRRSHKRKRVQREGTLTVEEGQRLTALREFGARGDGKKAKKRVRAEGGEPSQRRCGQCNKTGHNVRTCKQAAEIASE